MSGRRIGNYLIVDYLGGGGFGSVFKAEDTSTPGRVVAIKELHKKHTRSAVIKQRFFQEAIAMAKLDHENLPKLYTFGEDNGSYYLVMEFLSGKLLTDEIHDRKQLSLAQALAIITQVLDAVSYAHRNGIIHRDLKPDNIMLGGDLLAPKVKVLDFGIARMVGGENLTMAGEGFGTPTYMSPERIAGDNNPDSRSDIYSLGIILYEMLAGSPPFQSSSTDPLLYWSEMRAMHESQPLPSVVALGVPAEIEQVIGKATAKTKEERYASADDMLAELRALTTSETLALASEVKALAQLFITTAPAAAEVYLDDTQRGTSDAVTGKLFLDRLEPGVHSVRVAKSGYNEYDISVALTPGKRADLQVTLAARATVVMPQVMEETNPFNARTVRMESGDEVATAMLSVEGMPVGSKVLIGAQVVAQAGEDGKATLRLEPGVHELQVTTPAGAVGRQLVTLTQKDTGSLKTVAMPVTPDTDANPATTTRATALAGAVASEPSPTKRRLALAAAVVLLVGLAASAYLVFRKPSPIVAGTAALQPSNLAPPEPPAPTTATAGDEEETIEDERAAIEKAREELERDRKELEKKKQAIKEAEAKGATKESATVAGAPPVAAVPAIPPGNAVAPANAETGCVGVRVIGPDGQPVPRARVMFLSAYRQEEKRTGADGGCGACGLPVGSKLAVLVFRPNGAVISRKVIVNAGKTGIEIKLERPRQMMQGAQPDVTPAAPASGEGSDPQGVYPRRPRHKRPLVRN